MAAEQTIDRLQVEINAKASRSVDGLEKLAQSIQKLKSSVGSGVDKLSGIASSLNNLNTSTANLKGKSGTITSLVSSLDKLNNVDTSKIGGKIESLKTSLNSLGFMSGEIKTLVNSLGNLAGSDTGNVSQNALKTEAAIAKAQATIDKSTLTSAKSQQGLSEIAAKNNQIAESAKFAAEAEQSLNDAVARATSKSAISAEPVVWDRTTTRIPSATASEITGGGNLGLSESMNSASSSAKNASNSIKEVKRSTDDATESVSRFGGSAQNAFRLANLYAAYYILKRVESVLSGFVTSITSYIENMNLFDVAMGSAAQSGEKLANSLQDVLGVDSGEAERYMGLLQQIDTSFGVTNKNAVTMSENLTQLGYDIASFYNISTATSFEKLESGITGQTKALRQLGIDTSQARLQQELYNLGIKAKVTDLSQADKAELRYIAIMKQTTNAQGDMARTIQTPANALRVLQAQLAIAGRAIGSIFIPALESILPPVIAAVEVIGDMASELASLAGFEMPKIDYSSLKDVTTEADDAATATGAIGDNAKKSKKQIDNLISGFDELNILDTSSTETSAGAGTDGTGSVLGGIDLPSYNALSTAVSSNIDDIKKKLETYEPLLKELFTWVASIGAAWLTWKLSNTLLGGLTNLFPSLKAFSGMFVEISAGLAVVAGLFTYAYTHSENFRRGLGILGDMFNAVGKQIDVLAIKFNLNGEQLTTLAAEITAFVGVCAIALGAPVFGTILVVGAAAVLAIQGLGYAASNSIEPVNLFGDGISSATEKKVKPFITEMDKLDQTIKGIKWSGKIVTDSDVADVKAQVKKIADTIIYGLDADKNSALTKLNPLKSMLDSKTYDQIISANQKYYDTQKKNVTDGEAEIVGIYQKASSQHRQVSADEYKEIDKITNDMKTTGVKTLSASETESNLILQRMKDNATSLSAQQASEIVKNSVKARDETIANAQKQYDGICTEAQKMYDAGSINKTQYDKMIEAATGAKDSTIKSAQEQHTKIVDEAKKQAGDLSDQVDWSTGDIKSKWQVFWDDHKKQFELGGLAVLSVFTLGLFDLAIAVVTNWTKIKAKFVEGWDNVETFFKEALPNWWTSDVAPWFTAEKWEGLGENMKQGISEKWNEFTTQWNSSGPIKWWGENVTPWFEKAKWQKVGEDAINGLWGGVSSIWNDFMNWWKNLHIPTPHLSFDWDTDTSSLAVKAAKQLGLKGVPTMNVDWYKSGGIFNSAQVIGVGESGPEAVVPLSEDSEWIKGLSAQINNDTEKSSNSGSSNNENDMTKIALMAEQNKLLQALLEKDTTIKVNEKVLAKSVNKTNSNSGFFLGLSST